MKIFMITDYFNSDLEYQENLLEKYYTKHGHEVCIVTSTIHSLFDYRADKYRKSTPKSVEYFGETTRVIRLPYKWNFLNRIRTFPGLVKLLRQEKPDLIFLHETIPDLLQVVRYLKENPSCRAILDCHSDYSNATKNPLFLRVLHGLIRGSLLRYGRPYLSRIFPVVPASVTFLHEVYGVPLEEMEVLPLGADLDVIDDVRQKGEGEQIRQALAISPEDIVIVSGGKLEPRKQIELLIEAVKLLQSPLLHIVILGDYAPEHQDYKSKIEKLSRDLPNVHFVGWQSSRQIYQYMAAADLAVFPASQSVMWQKAIASGLPLVVGDTGNQSISYLNLHDNIVILENQDIAVEPLARTIGRIVGNDGLLERMRAGAERVGREHLDWNILIERTLRYCPGYEDAKPGGQQAG